MDQQTLASKLNSVPPKIKAWFSTEELAAQIGVINTHFNLSKDLASVLPRLILRLEIKDIEPEYFSGELASELALDKEKALSIVSELKRVIFNPIKNDLAGIGVDIALLDKFQVPIIKDLKPSTPKMIQDVSSITLPNRPIQAIPPAPPAPKPSLADKGWSKMSPSDPMVKLAPAQTPPPVPKPVVPQAAPAPKPAAPGPMQSSVGEFARFAKPQPPTGNLSQPSAPPRPSPSQPPAAPKPSSGPAPMMLHEDPGVQSIKGSSDFRISMSYQEGNLMGSSKAQPAPTKPAVIDFGGKSPQNTGFAQPNKVVHYTELKPSVPIPPASAAGRSVSEVTAAPVRPAPKPTGFTSVPVPMPPKPPAMPPQASKPPAPPTAPGTPSAETKVIKKDYV